jgi:hypothetical protein
MEDLPEFARVGESRSVSLVKSAPVVCVRLRGGGMKQETSK